MQCRCDQILRAVPGKRAYPELFAHRECDITSVPNHVDKKSVGNLFLDLLHVKQIVGTPDRPAFFPLQLRDLSHHELEKTASASALTQNLIPDRVAVETGNAVHRTLQPDVHQSFPITASCWVAKLGKDEIKYRGLSTIISETPGGQEDVVKKSRTGTSGADHEYGRAGAACRVVGHFQFSLLANGEGGGTMKACFVFGGCVGQFEAWKAREIPAAGEARGFQPAALSRSLLNR